MSHNIPVGVAIVRYTDTRHITCLAPVAGEEKNGRATGLQRVGEAFQAVQQRFDVRLKQQRGAEARTAQRSRHILCVVRAVAQRRGLVLRHADAQRVAHAGSAHARVGSAHAHAAAIHSGCAQTSGEWPRVRPTRRC